VPHTCLLERRISRYGVAPGGLAGPSGLIAKVRFAGSSPVLRSTWPERRLAIQACAIVRPSALRAILPKLAVKSIKNGKDLDVLGPSSRFLRPNDIAEIGDQDEDVIDSHCMSFSGELFVSACDPTRHE